MRILRITAALIVACCIGLTACGGGGGSNNTTPPPPPTLSSITVSSTGATVVVGMTLQMSAQGKYSDGTTKDMTSSVTWSSSDTNIATISAAGLVTGVASGSVNIKAASGSVSNQSAVAVNKPAITSVAVNASSTTVPLGASQQVVATASYENNTSGPITESVTWASSDTSVFAIDATGLATAKASTGTAEITATAGGKTSTPVTLAAAEAAPKALMIYPAMPTLAVYQWVQPLAYVVYTDNTVQDRTAESTFSVEDAAVLTLTSPRLGSIIGKAAGTTKLNASFRSLTASTDVTVAGALASIAISPKTGTVHQQGELLYEATGKFDTGASQTPMNFVSWSSGNQAVADFTQGQGGLLKGLTAGIVAITAALGGKADDAEVTVDDFVLQSFAVTPASDLSMAVNVTNQLVAEGTFTDGTNTEEQVLKNVQWSSTDEAVATVSSNGLVRSLSPGTTTITAKLPGGLEQTLGIVVAHGTMESLEVTVDKSSPKVGDVVQFKSTVHLTDGRSFDVTSVTIWLSSDGNSALVDASGKMLARKVGDVTVSAVFGKTVTTPITIGSAQ